MTFLAASICQLLSGCSIKVSRCLIPIFARNSLTPLSMNYFPLSNIKVLGISNLHTMFFQINLLTLVVETTATSLASIHFVKWSMPTRRKFTCPFAGGKGPTMYTPQVAKGHEAFMLCNSLTSRWDILQNLWHSSHFFIYFVQYLLIVGR